MMKYIASRRVSASLQPFLRALTINCAALILCLIAAVAAQAATYTVTNVGDTGMGSLRQAVLDANGTAANDVIVFNIPAAQCNATTGVCTITLTTGEIAVTSNGSLTINGTGANRLTISGGGVSRIFYTNGATFTLSGVTLTNGNAVGALRSGNGGAILVLFGTTVIRAVNVTGNTASAGGIGGGAYFQGGANHQIVNSTFSSNSAPNNVCGGFFNDGGTMTVTNTTISGNTTGNVSGGGFCNNGTLTLRGSTVAGNTGNGIVNYSTLNIGNSIVAGNTGANADIRNESGTTTTAGYNLIGNNSGVTTQFPTGVPNGTPNANNDIVGTSASPVLAQLAPLGNYGGTTQTRALCTAANVPNTACTGASPAIDKGSAVAGVTTDGRGVIRPYDIFATTNATGGNGADIGAFELIPTSAFGWGLNSNGAVGDGTTDNRSLPTAIAGGFTDIVAVEGGRNHALALRSNGTLLAWGSNNNGQLGDGTTTQSNSPVTVSGGLTTVTAIAGGEQHSLALLADGTIRAWGSNNNGQLGDNSTTNSSTPVIVTGITTAVAVAAGGVSSYALLADGSVRAWGRNSDGQLGDNSFTNRLTPVQVSGLTAGVISIDGGSISAYALLADGSVRAWGSNSSGRLGDGTTTTRITPVTPTNLTSNVVQIAGGDLHGVALKADGTVLTWGNDGSGQLGDGAAGGTNVTPTAITLANVVEIKCTFGSTTYARRRDGSLVAWGLNGSGEVGNGSLVTPQATPVTVSADTGSGFFGAARQNGYAGSPLAPVTAGANQFVRLGDATVNFPNVSTAGNLQIRTFSPTGVVLSDPANYTVLANATAYDITSSAQFTGTATVCLKVPNIISQASFNLIFILHDDDGDGTLDRSLLGTRNYQKREVCRETASFSPFVLAQGSTSTAASATVGGRVTTASGTPIKGVRIIMTDAATGEQRAATSTAFGYYRFSEVAAGGTYIFTAASKRFSFAQPTQVRSITAEVDDLDFTANE